MSKAAKSIRKSIELQRRTLANLNESRAMFDKHPAHQIDIDRTIETTKEILTTLENKLDAVERLAI